MKKAAEDSGAAEANTASDPPSPNNLQEELEIATMEPRANANCEPGTNSLNQGDCLKNTSGM